MKIRVPECMVGDIPSRGEDEQIGKRRSRLIGGDNQDTKYRRVNLLLVKLECNKSRTLFTYVINRNRADTDETLQIVFVRDICIGLISLGHNQRICLPDSCHARRRRRRVCVCLSATEESAEALVDDLPTAIRVDVKGRYRVLEVAGVSELVGAQRAKFGLLIMFALETYVVGRRANV
jgi:hypothetical protein